MPTSELLITTGQFFKGLKPEERESPAYRSAFAKYTNFLNGYYATLEVENVVSIPKGTRKRFYGGNLTPDDVHSLNNRCITPKLISFKKELDRRITEKGAEEYAPIEEDEENETA